MAGGFSQEFPPTSRLLAVRTLPKIRLDRGQRGSGNIAASVGFNSDISLYNNTNQTQIIVVRGLHWGPAASGPVNLSVAQGASGGAASTGNVPLLPDRGKGPGAINGNYPGSVPAGDIVLYLQSLEQAFSGEYPMIVVLPSWSLHVTCPTTNVALTVSFVWEALSPDEFVESYGEYV